MMLTAIPSRNFKRGTLPNQIEFDPNRALSTAGGNGELYRGVLHRNSHPDGSPFQYSNVALKRMRWGTDDKDTRLDSILNEAYVWKDILHPNVLRFLGLLSEDDDMYLVAPFAPHGSLPQYIAIHIDVDRPMLIWQISIGIAYLHEHNIIHGDVKGANVLVFDGPTAKICDFGLSKFRDGKPTTSPQYSLHWASPERLKGEPRSYASDVYAFGMTIYEILSNEIPFSTLNFVTLFHAICTKDERPPQRPDSSSTGVSYASLWAVAERCWRKAVDKRLSMKGASDLIRPAEVGLVVESDLDGLTVFSMPQAPSDATNKKRRRASSVSDPSCTTVSDGPRRDPTECSPTALGKTHEPESRGVAKRTKLGGECVADKSSEGGSIAHNLAGRHLGPQSAIVGTTVSTQTEAICRHATDHADNETDGLRIFGAVVVQHHDLKLWQMVRPQNRDGTSGFWTDLVEAEVAGRRSLVKMYPKRGGGERAFLRDIKHIGDCLFGLPRARAYCLKSSIPFIVLEAESTKPLKDHLLDLAANVLTDVADRKIWNTFADLNTAAKCISSYCQDIRPSSLSAALKDARVDQHGQIVLAPEWCDSPGLDFVNQSGASELTRNMLKKLLMGDHGFHRMSCITFTFGAASWDYMTRDDVLNLKDKSRAEAHYCSHARSSSSICTEECASDSYEAWTQCSCLNHQTTRPRRYGSIIPRLSKSASQALDLRLTSQVKIVVSDIVGASDNQTVAQHGAISDTEELEILPPKFWALLLIADEFTIQTPQSATFSSSASKWGTVQGGSAYGRTLPPLSIPSANSGYGAPGPAYMSGMSPIADEFTIQTPQSATFPSSASKWGTVQGGSAYGRTLPPLSIPSANSGYGAPGSAYMSGMSPHDDGSYGGPAYGGGSSSSIPGLRDSSMFAYNSESVTEAQVQAHQFAQYQALIRAQQQQHLFRQQLQRQHPAAQFNMQMMPYQNFQLQLPVRGGGGNNAANAAAAAAMMMNGGGGQPQAGWRMPLNPQANRTPQQQAMLQQMNMAYLNGIRNGGVPGQGQGQQR